MCKVVWIVTEQDLDPFCGYYILGVFSTREKAEKFVEENCDKWMVENGFIAIEEWEVE